MQYVKRGLILCLQSKGKKHKQQRVLNVYKL